MAILSAVAAVAAMSPFCLHAQQAEPFGFALYDADRLYDTVPSPMYDDADFTPRGDMMWNTARYRRKVAQTAAMLDLLAVPVVALCGFEGEATLRDIAARSRTGYSYVYGAVGSWDGLDFALLYLGDTVFPQWSECRGGVLTVGFETGGGEYAAVLVGAGGDIGEAVARVRRRAPSATVIAAGCFTSEECRRCGLCDAVAAAEKRGRGSRFTADGWEFAERVAADADAASEFDSRDEGWLLDDGRVPVPTFDDDFYLGGAGGRLPVCGVIRQKIE